MIVSPLLALMRNQIEAARRGRDPRADDQLVQHRRLGPDLRRGRRGRRRRPARQPRAAQQSRLPRPRPAQARGRGRAGRRRRGALHLRLGPRLPPRLPQAAHPARRAAAGHPGPGHHRDRQRPRHPGRRRAARRRTTTLVLRGPLERESLRLAVVVRCPTAEQRLGVARRAPRTSCPAPGSSTRSPSPPPTRSPATCATAATRSPPTPARPSRPSGSRPSRTCSTTRSRRWSPPARSAWASTSPTSASSSTWARRSRPVAYYQQIGRAGRGVERAEVILLPGREDREIWAYFAGAGLPAGAGRPRHPRRAGGSGPPAVHRARSRPRVDLSRGRLEMMLKVLDVDGAVRRVKGGWTATGAAVGLRRASATSGSPPSVAASSRPCSTTSATDGCRMEFLRRQLDDPAAAPCGRCDNCTGQPLARRGPRGERLAGAASGCTAPASTVEPRRMWPTGMKADLGVSGRIPPSSGRAGPGAGPPHRHRLGQPPARAVRRRRRRTPRSDAWWTPSSRCSPPGTGRSPPRRRA